MPGIRQDGGHVRNPAFLLAQKAVNRSVLHGKEIPPHRETVDQAVRTGTEIINGLTGESFVVQPDGFQVLIRHVKPVQAAEIDSALRILRDGTDSDGAGTSFAVQLTDLAVRKIVYAGVVGADPQPVRVIDEQTANVFDLRGGGDLFKCVSVIADQAGIIPDPDKAVARLGNGVGLRGRHAVPAVVDDGGIALRFSDRINGKPDVSVSGGIQNLKGGFAAAGAGKKDAEKSCQQQNRKRPVRPVFPGNGSSCEHEVSSFDFPDQLRNCQAVSIQFPFVCQCPVKYIKKDVILQPITE